MTEQPRIQRLLGLFSGKPLRHQQITLGIKSHVKMAVRLFNAVQTRIQRFSPQAGEREHTSMSLLKKVLHGGEANRQVIGGDARPAPDSDQRN